MNAIVVLFFIFSLFVFHSPALASYDPRSVPNNKFGIHILFPEELFEAQKLVNSAGGDWGYVTIPIQSSDKNLDKWQKFMDDAKSLHIIPIIRLSTTGDYFNTTVWEKPKLTDIVDFANFLDSLDWPTKNRYIVIYNEVNRGDEWGGSPDPFEYAQILDFAADSFKAKNPDFFVISAGLDNAAPNIFGQYMNELDFMRAMSYEVPDVFEKIDGFSSHSYPNPGFSHPPGGRGTRSFRIEQNLIFVLSGKTLPVFITETGWSTEAVQPSRIADYYKQSFANDWKDENIVAVTPFLLKAGGEPFSKFSFLSETGENPQYESVSAIQKVRGEPKLADIALKQEKKVVLPSKTFQRRKKEPNIFTSAKKVSVIFKWLLGF